MGNVTIFVAVYTSFQLTTQKESISRGAINFERRKITTKVVTITLKLGYCFVKQGHAF